MKKTIYFLFGIFLCSVCYSNAQMSYGVKAGVNISSLTGEFKRGIGQKSMINFHAGFVTEFPLSDRFSLQPEAYFSRQGTQIVQPNGNEIKYHLDYVNIPVLAKFYIVEGYSSVEIGPQFSVQTSEKLDPNVDGKEEYTRDFDKALVLGTTYQFDNGLFCSLRFNVGFSDLFITHSLYGNGHAASRYAQFSVGYKF